ncbi:MAG: GTP-binding protein [Candidatus Heimdallarchaeota archaeon]|nr:GTP-binding protein [Candidatus Heimdallarchaeota archaeon]MBY8993017.1 GTP-binding protein [Candidatus Heimdallarchaeota archaeon]
MAKLIFKVVIIGDPAVGKTSIRRKYLGETTNKEYIYTIGADFATKRIKLSNNLSVQYQIFDLAGQQKFDKVRATFYSGVQAAILVYDITDNNTLRNLPKWIREAKKNNDGTLETFVIVGNKIDLMDQKQSNDALMKKIQLELSKEMGHNIMHIYSSALTGENIDSLFKKLTYELLVAYSKESPEIANLLREVESKLVVKTPTISKPEILPSKADVKDKALESIVENRLRRFELEIGHLKSEIRELHIDIQYLQDLILKYINDHKDLLEKISLRDDF